MDLNEQVLCQAWQFTAILRIDQFNQILIVNLVEYWRNLEITKLCHNDTPGE